ncbi:hypothetical protein MNB_SV-14-1107 [hydrothermal vent metagenome]|uniref:Lipoprotein n=1 Tax=hydrothermal vent metagenome TaxID=652676 RepID=A0A1W1CHX3_9ZZZZ
MKNILLLASVLFLSSCLSTGSGKPIIQGGSASGYIGCYNGVCTEFLPKKNKNGVILTSTGVQYELASSSTTSKKMLGRETLNIETLYVGKSCDTFSKRHGKGYWGWNSSGFNVEFKSIKFVFSNQQLDIDKDVADGCHL